MKVCLESDDRERPRKRDRSLTQLGTATYHIRVVLEGGAEVERNVRQQWFRRDRKGDWGESAARVVQELFPDWKEVHIWDGETGTALLRGTGVKAQGKDLREQDRLDCKALEAAVLSKRTISRGN